MISFLEILIFTVYYYKRNINPFQGASIENESKRDAREQAMPVPYHCAR
jgi:hypothetical protein